MSKITIIEGNSNDKDNVRNFMVKGEKGSDGVSPSVETSKTGNTATITITDVEGEHEFDLTDGVSPTITSSKQNKVTTLTIVDADGTKTATINDGVDLTGGVPTNGVIAFDGVAADIPDGYEVSSSSIATITNSYSTSTSEGYSANYINGAISDVVSSGTGYVKYADGTMICYGNSTSTNIQNSSEYSEDITLPQSYLTGTFTVLVSLKSGGAGWGGVVCRGGSLSASTIRLIAGNYILPDTTANSIVMSYITIGKWK